MIKELHLENFKCFQNETIALTNLNLLAGLNGMGKSTVIQALLLLRQNYENGLLNFQKKLGLNGEYIEIGTGADLLYKYFDKREVGIQIRTTSSRKYSWKWNASLEFDIIDEISSSYGRLETLSLFSNKFHYLSAERVGPRPFYKTSTAKVIHQNQLGVNGEFAANYFAQYQGKNIPIPGLCRKQGEGLTLYEQVNSWLGVIRPGTRVVVREEPNSGIISLNFEFSLGKDSPGVYKATNVGFGLTYVFPLLTAILFSKPKTLLLLENPEAHIHPKGQAEFGLLLAKAAAGGIQIIVETHSDHILNGIRYGVKQKILDSEQCSLLFFSGKVINDRFKHLIDYIKVSSTGKLSHRPEDFFDVWEKMLVKLV
jgi:predicted ATPase